MLFFTVDDSKTFLYSYFLPWRTEFLSGGVLDLSD